MEIRELRVFVAVVDAGGLSAAARRLHLSQSTISETILGLERQLGSPLLVRSREGARPTATGEALADGARDLLRLHDRIEADIVASGHDMPAVRLGVPLELPGQLIQNLVATLADLHSEVQIQPGHASTAVQWRELEAGGLDVALVRELRPADWFDSTLVVQAIGVVLPSVPAADPDNSGPVKLDRLGGLLWSGFPRSDSPGWYDQVVAVLRSHGVQVPEADPDDRRPVIADVKLAAVASGRAFALAAPGFRLPDGLTWRPLVGDPVVRRTWAVWDAASTSRHIAAVVDALERIATLQPHGRH